MGLSPNDLDSLIERLAGLPPDQLKNLDDEIREGTSHLKWVPNPGPQTDGYFSLADVVLFGGEPGGGKSSLLLGLAFTQHERSLIMRRQYGDLERLIEDALKIHGSRNGFNGAPPPKLRINDRQSINFVAAHRVGDEHGQMGRGHDFIGFDEATHFAESQIRFVMGWLRTETEGQRCRVVMATNPPVRPEGLWVMKMFAPWLDPRYENPAKHGELRWVISDDDGDDLWVAGPDDAREVMVGGRMKLVQPTSRTYIPSKVSDNPFYAATDYERQLDSMQEPWRSLLLGGFRTAFEDDVDQVIPTAWIQEAQKRWTANSPASVPQCAIGVDGARVNDDYAIAPRYDGWYAPIVSGPGRDTPHGRDLAVLVIKHRRNNSVPVIDVLESVGAQAYAHLEDNEIKCHAYRGNDKSVRRTAEKQLGFFNKRAEAYWRFREALDPEQDGGSPIMLPDDPELVADLTAPTWELSPNGIKILTKEKVVDKLGRSPNKGDAVVMAWTDGAKMPSHYHEWRRQNSNPQVNLGRMGKRSKRWRH